MTKVTPTHFSDQKEPTDRLQTGLVLTCTVVVGRVGGSFYEGFRVIGESTSVGGGPGGPWESDTEGPHRKCGPRG